MDNQSINKLKIAFEDLDLEVTTKNKFNNKEYITNRKELNQNLKSKIASATPFRRELTLGKEYLYCTCGLSRRQVNILNY
jgi:hypothetical protein